MSHMNVPNWKQRLTAEMKRDKKKAAVLAVLCVVGGIVIGRLVMKQFSPSKANAASGPSATAVTPSSSMSSSMSPAMTSQGRGQGDNSRKWREYIAKLDTRVSRDIFLPDESVFPPHTEKKSVPQNVVIEKGPTDEEKFEAMKKTILAQAQALTLQSTIVSSIPTAMINNRVLRKGDLISGFRVVRITPRTCSLMKDEITVTLGMKGQTINTPPQEADDRD